MTAELHVLSAGYAHERVASTVVLIRDEGRAVVVDPGMVADRRMILDPLRALGVDPSEVADVVFSTTTRTTRSTRRSSSGPVSTTSGRSTRTTSGSTDRLTGSSSRRRCG